MVIIYFINYGYGNLGRTGHLPVPRGWPLNGQVQLYLSRCYFSKFTLIRFGAPLNFMIHAAINCFFVILEMTAGNFSSPIK